MAKPDSVLLSRDSSVDALIAVSLPVFSMLVDLPALSQPCLPLAAYLQRNNVQGEGGFQIRVAKF